MELTWLMRFRIAAAAAVGIVLIGLIGFSLVSPCGDCGVVQAVDIGLGGAVLMVAIAVVCGFLGYFASWPYGREVGILAVPFGLGLWAMRSSSMSSLMQLNPAFEQRQALVAMLRFEPVFWLALVASGFAGVLLAQHLMPSKKVHVETDGGKYISSKYLNLGMALFASVLLAQLCMSVIVSDVRMSDNRLGMVVGQPSHGQIVFGVIVSFAITGFVVKKFLGADYIIPALASAIVTAVATILYAKPDTMQYMASRWPGAFFATSTVAILPVQMVAFGSMGAVAGYWMAVRFDWWRKHENQ